jgi:hypothetical protein
MQEINHHPSPGWIRDFKMSKVSGAVEDPTRYSILGWMGFPGFSFMSIEIIRPLPIMSNM